MSSGLSTWTLLTATAGLLGFLVGVYTLVGRDRKSPYLINSMFAVFLVCLVGAAIDLAAEISPWQQNQILVAGAGVLLGAILLTIWRLWTIYVRLAYFVDPGPKARLKLLPGIRQLRARRKRTIGPTYEHNPLPLGEDLQKEILSTIADSGQSHRDGVGPENYRVNVRDEVDPRALAMALQHLGQANEILGRLAIAFLKRPNHYVQYMTASRHPVEFIDHLRRIWSEATPKWEEARARIVAVDAYTHHFGFLDTINGAKSEDVRKELGGRLLAANETFAGLHSASSAAFKMVKRQSGTPSMRQPTLVIYEDMYALSDLESVEQYRIFARHVLPSERLWGGMFTVFAETAQREEDWKLISSYTGMTLDLRSVGRSQSKEATST
jgi:hypothetical protein